MMKSFYDPLSEWKDFDKTKKELQKNRKCEICGIAEAAKPHMAAGLCGEEKSLLFVTYSEQKAYDLLENIAFFRKDAMYFPGRDMLFYKSDVGGGSISSDRLKVYQSVATGISTVVTTFDALMNRCVAPYDMRKFIITCKKGDTVDLEKLKRSFAGSGYEREISVTLPGQFAIRGDIVDVFPLNATFPYRMELWGDEIDSIRTFDPETQRSVTDEEEVIIYPGSEDLEGVSKNSSLLDYFDWDETVCFLDEPVKLEEQGRAVNMEVASAVENRLDAGLDVEELSLLTSEETIFEKLSMHSCVSLCVLDRKNSFYKADFRTTINAKNHQSYGNSFDLLVEELAKYRKNKFRVVLVSASKSRAERLARDIDDAGVPCVYTGDTDRKLEEREVDVVYGNLVRGFEYPLLKFAVITENDIFVRNRRKTKYRKYSGAGHIKSFNDLKVGDFVVHENHGLGIYRGIEKVEVDSVIKDYMKIEYGDGGALYILATQFDLIQKYASADDSKPPKLNKLSGNDWQKTKSKVRESVELVAEDLVELYAKRQHAKGFRFTPDTLWQKEFEEMFPYDETTDQLKAIEDTKRDMESDRIMDRLICGDVGFGKTEIAIRAAFKAVQDGKQVALLVPTTILAKQHFDTFSQRLSAYPVNVDLLCRFRTAAEQKKTVERLRSGAVDIVIGTHRLLSKDITFKDLGLLIVDEEQRFGVTHKEKIKTLKTNVDVMALSATPIPRTLSMSLTGIREMSVLEEAPVDRLPIQTYVMEYHDELVREAITRELARDGQVYFVSNNINTISDVAARISNLVPDANVVYAHGRMNERELENIMFSFVNGDIDVLVSTTIIETGLDIPNVNTIIVRDADRYGLSQLYQLRGRVGRSGRSAYAFFMYRRDKILTEVAEKRLTAIKEFTDLGSGIKIAMRDLEIRGAGSLLGKSQSGHMVSVGYELYCKMLNAAVRKARGDEEDTDIQTTIDLLADAYIPPDYIISESEKLDMYKRISTLTGEQEKDELVDELEDRYGEIPGAVNRLLAVAMLKPAATAAYITNIKEKRDEIAISILPTAKIDPDNITSLLTEYGGALRFIQGEKPGLILNKRHNSRIAGIDTLDFLTSLCKALVKKQNK